MENNKSKQMIFEYILTDNDHKNLNNSQYAFALFNKSLEHINMRFAELNQHNTMVKINFQDNEKPHFFIISDDDKNALLGLRCIQLLANSVSSFFVDKERQIEFYGRIQGYKPRKIIDDNNIDEVYEKENLFPVQTREFQIKKNNITNMKGYNIFTEKVE